MPILDGGYVVSDPEAYVGALKAAALEHKRLAERTARAKYLSANPHARAAKRLRERARKRETRTADRASFNSYMRDYRAANPAATSATNKKWREANPSWRLLRAYGITAEQRDALLAEQGGTCKCCKVPNPGGRGWHVDHCHQTGVVRGVLCHKCNLGIGLFNDDPELLEATAKYLRSYPTVEGSC